MTYTGKESADPVSRDGDSRTRRPPTPSATRERSTASRTRRRSRRPGSTSATADRFIRFAARVALEHQDAEAVGRARRWPRRTRRRRSPRCSRLVRESAPVPAAHAEQERRSPADPALRAKILEALDRIDFAKLDRPSRSSTCSASIRCSSTASASRPRRTPDARRCWPSSTRRSRPAAATSNGELCQVLVYLDAPDSGGEDDEAAGATRRRRRSNWSTPARCGCCKTGWTPELRKEYFTWFLKAGELQGRQQLRAGSSSSSRRTRSRP